MNTTHCKTCGTPKAYEPNNSRNTSVAILLGGLGIGIAAGLMLARTSGAELRKDIRNCTNDTADFLKAEGNDLLKQTGNMVDSAANAAGETLDQARGMVREAGKFVQQHA